MMKAQITFKGGAQILIDVKEITLIRQNFTNEVVRITWTDHPRGKYKLMSLMVDEVAAIVTWEVEDEIQEDNDH